MNDTKAKRKTKAGRVQEKYYKMRKTAYHNYKKLFSF